MNMSIANDDKILFIGGALHGKHFPDDGCDIRENLIHSRINHAIVYRDDISKLISLKVERYERIKFACRERVFYAMVLKGTPLKDAIEYLEKGILVKRASVDMLNSGEVEL